MLDNYIEKKLELMEDDTRNCQLLGNDSCQLLEDYSSCQLLEKRGRSSMPASPEMEATELSETIVRRVTDLQPRRPVSNRLVVTSRLPSGDSEDDEESGGDYKRKKIWSETLKQDASTEDYPDMMEKQKTAPAKSSSTERNSSAILPDEEDAVVPDEDTLEPAMRDRIHGLPSCAGNRAARTGDQAHNSNMGAEQEQEKMQIITNNLSQEQNCAPESKDAPMEGRLGEATACSAHEETFSWAEECFSAAGRETMRQSFPAGPQVPLEGPSEDSDISGKKNCS